MRYFNSRRYSAQICQRNGHYVAVSTRGGLGYLRVMKTGIREMKRNKMQLPRGRQYDSPRLRALSLLCGDFKLLLPRRLT